MKTEIIRSNDREFLKVDLVQVNQKEHSFYLAKFKAVDFLKLYTVRPAQYDLEKHSALARTFSDDTLYYDHLISRDKENLKNKDFQRDPNEDRVNRIIKFLDSEEYAFFPNTVIANCDLANDWDDIELDESNSIDDYLSYTGLPDYLSFLHRSDNEVFLVIPYIANAILVIDGQHRLKGLEGADSSVKDGYELVIAFIIGFDRSVIAKQFYTINYEQKAVNKSLLYQLTGEFTTQIDEISFMHNVVKLLNELSESPFHGRIKMLGKTPKNIDPQSRALLSISQAFLIDSLIRYISYTARGSIYPPIFLKYFKNLSDHIVMVRAIARFFSAVRNLKPDWVHPENSLLSKGMGVGALIKVYNLLFPIIFIREMNSAWENLNNVTIEDYQRIVAGIENIDFSTDGPYGKTGSAGSINRIKEDIITKLEYIDRPPSFQAFKEFYEEEYLQPFNNALSAIS